MDKIEAVERLERNLEEWRKLRPQIGDFLCHIDGTVHCMESEQNNFNKRYLEIQRAIWRITGSEHLSEDKLGGNELMFIFNTNHIVNILSSYSLNSIVDSLDTYDACQRERKQILEPKFKPGDIVRFSTSPHMIVAVNDVVFENDEEYFWAEILTESGKWTERKFRAAGFEKIGDCRADKEGEDNE